MCIAGYFRKFSFNSYIKSAVLSRPAQLSVEHFHVSFPNSLIISFVCFMFRNTVEMLHKICTPSLHTCSKSSEILASFDDAIFFGPGVSSPFPRYCIVFGPGVSSPFPRYCIVFGPGVSPPLPRYCIRPTVHGSNLMLVQSRLFVS